MCLFSLQMYFDSKKKAGGNIEWEAISVFLIIDIPCPSRFLVYFVGHNAARSFSHFWETRTSVMATKCVSKMEERIFVRTRGRRQELTSAKKRALFTGRIFTLWKREWFFPFFRGLLKKIKYALKWFRGFLKFLWRENDIFYVEYRRICYLRIFR